MTIDKLDNWTRQKIEKEAAPEPHGYCERNSTYLQELQCFKGKPNRQENFNDHFLKPYN